MKIKYKKLACGAAVVACTIELNMPIGEKIGLHIPVNEYYSDTQSYQTTYSISGLATGYAQFQDESI